MLIRATGTIVDHLHLLTLGESCHYLLGEQESLTLIDPGLNCQIDSLMERIKQIGLSPAQIDRILLTHLDADRVGGLAAVRRYAPQARLLVPQAIMDMLSEPGATDSIAGQDLELQKLYSNIQPAQLDAAEFRTACKIDQVINESTLLELSDTCRIRPFRILGHSSHSFGYFLEPHQYFIVDESFGYYRRRDPASPGADYSLEDSITFLKTLAHFHIEGLCLPQAGVLAGALARRHIEDLLQNTEDLRGETRRALQAGYPQDYIKSYIMDSFYNLSTRDPLLRHNMQRSFSAIWEQLRSNG